MTAPASHPNTCRTCSSPSTAPPAAGRPMDTWASAYSLSIHMLRQWAGNAGSKVPSGPVLHFASASPRFHLKNLPTEMEGIEMSPSFHRAFMFACNNTRRMFEIDTSPGPTRRFLLVAGLAGSMLLGYGTAFAQAPSAISGTYKILIRGNYTGEGTATVTDGLVT